MDGHSADQGEGLCRVTPFGTLRYLFRAILHKYADLPAYSDNQCRDCDDTKSIFGWCRKCPYSLDAQFERFEREFHIQVTPELWAFMSRVFDLDEEMEMGLRPECERLELEAVKTLRRERRAFERYSMEKVKNRGE